MSMGMNISAGTIMAYMDLDMSSFNSALDMAGEQLSGFASGGVAGALGSIGAAAETAGRALTMHITGKLLDVGQAALQVGMDFDASMSNVYGLMSSLNLSQAQMDALRDTARRPNSAPAKLPTRWVIWRWQAGTMRRSLPVFRAY